MRHRFRHVGARSVARSTGPRDRLSLGRDGSISSRSDPLALAQDQKLQASVIDQNSFGTALALNGNVLIATAPVAPGGARAYVYARDNAGWSEQEVLVPAGASNGAMGMSVAIDADVLVLGDPFASPLAQYSGAVHVYRRSGSAWQPEQTLTPAAGAVRGRRLQRGHSRLADRDRRNSA
jgi:hypothetical protein